MPLMTPPCPKRTRWPPNGPPRCPRASPPAAGNEVASEVAARPKPWRPATFAKFTPTGAGNAGNDLNMILDIPVQLTVELGRTRIPIKHILQLAQGSVVELETMAGEPMDVLVNGYLIAQGEVVVVNDKFGIRLTDIVTPSERMRRLSRHVMRSMQATAWGSLLWFVASSAMIPLALWLLKRTPLGGAAAGPAGTPRTVAVLPLSAQQKLVTVEVGQGDERLWLVLGVSPQGITPCTRWRTDRPLRPTAPPAPPAAAFAQLLSRLRGPEAGGLMRSHSVVMAADTGPAAGLLPGGAAPAGARPRRRAACRW
jgi:flagellar motor switch protein FliN/FliY